MAVPFAASRDRPRLHHIAPVTFYISWGYVALNFLFGAGLISYHPRVSYNIAFGPFTFQFWAWMFFILGVVSAIALLRNNWRAIRITLGIALFIKALWFFALLFRITDGGALVTLAMWSFIAFVQLLTVIFFPED